MLTQPPTLNFSYPLAPPHIPDEYPAQRWFSKFAAPISVYRNAGKNIAQIGFSQVNSGSNFEITLKLSPKEMTDLACKLLNAVKDIEENPAEKMAAQLAGGAV